MKLSEHIDVLIIGAGISGVDAAYWLKKKNPERSWAIFEARDAIGGTWDLFRYPGVRSDSDMTTLGFPFRPWRGAKAIAGGDEIRHYVRETAREFGINRKVRFHHRVTAAAWSSAEARWTVSFEADGEARRITCSFLFLCSGYYDYDEGHAPVWPSMDTFAGQVVHPQFWPTDFAVAGRRIVVIGSGATAVTLIPALVAKGAAHVTMLQRSPTYIVSRPAHDELGDTLRRWLPSTLAESAVRWKNIGYGMLVFALAQRKPHVLKRKIAAQQKAALGPGFEMGEHFTPSYDPWDQRLCLIPDADLFNVFRDGQASIATDRIARFTPAGIGLESGRELAADVIVTATGLKIKLMGGAALSVDGETVDPAQRLLYKGSMLDGVPNFAFSVGYTNASWTLKCDLTSQFVSRVLTRMTAKGLDTVVPVAAAGAAMDEPMLALKSGYVERAARLLPRQGAGAPWKTSQNYVSDLLTIRAGRLDDGVLSFAAKYKNQAKETA